MAKHLVQFTNNDLENILGQFTIAPKIYSYKPLTNGLINDTFLVVDNQNPLYILQRINHNVFKDVKGLMNNISLTLQQLSALDYQKITLVKTHDGSSYYEYSAQEKSYWRLMTFISGSVTYNTTTSNEIAFEAGRIIGKFQFLLADVLVGNYVDTIPKFHNLSLRENQFTDAVSLTDSTRLGVAKKDIEFAKSTLEKLHDLNPGELPLRVCHNDTKLNNILFSTDNKALCLIDLDTLMKGYFLYDFGDAIRTIANTAPEDEQDHDKITFQRPLFEAFINGLASNDKFLSKAEIDSLGYGTIVMPFLHGIRALTDYLNGNVYYKVAYENQNLDRARSLFNFTEKAISNLDFIQEVCQKKL